MPYRVPDANKFTLIAFINIGRGYCGTLQTKHRLNSVYVFSTYTLLLNLDGHSVIEAVFANQRLTPVKKNYKIHFQYQLHARQLTFISN